MNRELYFIPILQDALKAKDLKSALSKAVTNITQLGKDNLYKEGFENFQKFINEVYDFDDILKKNMNSEPTEYLLDSNLDCKFSIFQGDTLIYIGNLDKSQIIRSIAPGTYAIKLSTGRILWRGEITEEELIMRKNLDGQNIKLAADSEDFKPEPVRIITLLKGQMFLKIFKGFDGGSLQIELQ